MKRWLPWIVPGVFAAWIIGSAFAPSKETGFHTREFGKLPVLFNGRIQPFDSVARNALLVMRGKQSVALEKGERLSADEWLMETMLGSGKSDERPLFRVDHPELLDMMHLSHERKYFSFNELQPQMGELHHEAQRISKLEAQERTVFEKQTLKLYNGVMLYFRLKNAVRPEGADDFSAELAMYQQSMGPAVEAMRARQAGETADTEALALMKRFLDRYQMMAQLEPPLAVPPLHPTKDREGWASVGTSLVTPQEGTLIHPAVQYYASMSTAYAQGHVETFNQKLKEYRSWLEGNQLGAAVSKGVNESFYNHYAPFYKSIVLYVCAFLFACGFWFNWSPWMRQTAFNLLLVALVVHSSGLIFRMVLEGRPPVTNLYSSAVFVGWGAVVLGLVLERVFRDGIGAVTAAAVGFLTLVIAHNLSLDGDTMEMLRAVLDTNFWLATHVVVITLGYASVFVSGFLAIVYVVRGVFTKTLSAGTARSLTRMIYGIVCFSTLFSFVGTVLGGIWADQSWGRFWGWDPKENGALIIVLWCAIVLHARWGGMIRERGLVACAIFGNVVTSYSWFGVNMLGVGLHSYGFMDQAFKWLMVFVGLQLGLIGLALMPREYWRSFRNPKLAPAGKAGASKPLPPGKPAPAT